MRVVYYVAAFYFAGIVAVTLLCWGGYWMWGRAMNPDGDFLSEPERMLTPAPDNLSGIMAIVSDRDMRTVRKHVVDIHWADARWFNEHLGNAAMQHGWHSYRTYRTLQGHIGVVMPAEDLIEMDALVANPVGWVRMFPVDDDVMSRGPSSDNLVLVGLVLEQHSLTSRNAWGGLSLVLFMLALFITMGLVAAVYVSVSALIQSSRNRMAQDGAANVK